MLARDRAPVLRGGEIEIDGVQQERGAGAVLAGAAQNRHEVALQGADPEPLVDLLRGEFPFLQEFLDQGVVALRGKIEQIAAQRLHLILEVVGDGARFQLAAPGRRHVGLLADQIHHAFETGFPADGEQDGHGLDLQHFPDFLERLVKIGPFPVHLIDKDQAGQIVRRLAVCQTFSVPTLTPSTASTTTTAPSATWRAARVSARKLSSPGVSAR